MSKTQQTTFNSRGQMPPKDRFFGVGAGGPNPDLAKKMLGCAFNSVPVIESTEATFSLPLLDDDITQSLGNKVTIFNDQTVPGAVSVDSTFIQKGELQCDMLCYGVGVHIFGEPMTWMSIGNAINAAATAPIASPDAFTINDINQNAMGGTQAGTGTAIDPAIIHWGFDAWHAAWEMAQAYLFNWRFYQKLYLMSEQLADVSYFGPYAEAVAAGDSDVDVQEYAALVNARYRQLGSSKIFQPVGFRRLGSTTVSSNNTGLFTPTRDYDLASVTHGGLRNMGAVGCCQPFRRFNKPILLRRGIPIGIELQSNDSYHQAQMTRYLSISNSNNGSPADVPFDAQTDTGNSPAAAGVALEATTEASATPSFVPQSVKTKRFIFKGGCFKVAFLIKGFELTEDWCDFLAKNASANDLYNPAKAPNGGGPGMAPVGG